MKVSLLLAEFPGGYYTFPDVTDWVRRMMRWADQDGRFDRVDHTRFTGTPITMLRNRALLEASQRGYDYLLMVDADMVPDQERPRVSSAQEFLPSSIDWVYANSLSVPCVIFAPYVGPPPHENVYVFRWRSRESDHPNPDHQLEGYSREEAALMTGVQSAAAGPTGVILIDTRVIKYLNPPWFYYGYKDKYEAEKVMTEDVAFTRDVALAHAPDVGCPRGLPVLCNWDAWACHLKMKACGKPQLLTNDMVTEQYQEAVLSNRTRGGRLQIRRFSPDTYLHSLRLARAMPGEKDAIDPNAWPQVREPENPLELATSAPQGHWNGLEATAGV